MIGICRYWQYHSEEMLFFTICVLPLVRISYLERPGNGNCWIWHCYRNGQLHPPRLLRYCIIVTTPVAPAAASASILVCPCPSPPPLLHPITTLLYHHCCQGSPSLMSPPQRDTINGTGCINIKIITRWVHRENISHNAKKHFLQQCTATRNGILRCDSYLVGLKVVGEVMGAILRRWSVWGEERADGLYTFLPLLSCPTKVINIYCECCLKKNWAGMRGKVRSNSLSWSGWRGFSSNKYSRVNNNLSS